MALQQTSPTQQEGSCADRGSERGLGVLCTNPVDQPGVIDFAAGTPAAGHEQQIDRWMVVDGIVRLHLQAAGGTHQSGALGQSEDGEGRLAAGPSAEPGCDREDLKGSTKVEHFHIVKEQDADIHVPFSIHSVSLSAYFHSTLFQASIPSTTFATAVKPCRWRSALAIILS